MSEYYRCAYCESDIPAEELKIDHVNGGYAGEPHACCPHCGCDDLEEVFECNDCGRIVEQVFGGRHICADCLQKEIDLQDVVAYGEENKVQYEINGFWSFCFSEDVVNQILDKAFDALPDHMKNVLVVNYADEDPNGLADMI